MFGSKKGTLKEGSFVFTAKPADEYCNFVIGIVTGVDGNRVGVNGFIVNPVGLKNKVLQGKAGTRSKEMLKEPTSENCIFALIYRIEYENFTDVLDLEKEKVEFSQKSNIQF